MISWVMAHASSFATRSAGILRVGIVGSNPHRGWGSGVHRPVVQMLPGFELSAVCTTKLESAQEAARLFGARHAFTSAEDLANCPDVDVVSVCVLAPQHRIIAEAAIKAGKHVYCEWPLALTIKDAEELTALARTKGVKALIGLHLRGAPALRYAADLIREGYIGKLAGVSLVASLPGIITGSMATRAGGTTLTTICCGHLLDAMDFYFGGIADLDARSFINLPQADEVGRPINMKRCCT
jgi:predicted dehydrogenase